MPPVGRPRLVPAPAHPDAVLAQLAASHVALPGLLEREHRLLSEALTTWALWATLTAMQRLVINEVVERLTEEVRL